MRDLFEIGETKFRQWDDGGNLEVFANGVWTTVPRPAAETITFLLAENKKLKEVTMPEDIDIQELHEPAAWRFRIGMQNLWSYAENKSDAEWRIKQAGGQKYELQPLFLEEALSSLLSENRKLKEALAPVAKALDAYRFYVDASDQELADRGISRDDALTEARQLDPYDGETPSAIAALKEVGNG